MLAILPLASPLNPPEQVGRVIGWIGDRLARLAVPHRFVGDGDEPADALLVVTGGTEHLALAACARTSEPVFLLAHPTLNSLPAALEILSSLHQRGRPGRVVLVNEAGSDDRTLGRLPRHLDVRRRLRAARLGRIGEPSDWLVASVPEPELVTSAWGPTLVDVPMSEVVDAIRAADAGEVARVRDDVLRGAADIREPSPADLDSAAAVTVALRTVAARHRLDALTVRCFDLVTGERTSGCMALSCLLDGGVVAGCEGDVPATLTMLWLQAMTGEPAFMANPQDVDTGSGTLAIAHCTVARRLVTRYTLRSHFESSLGVGIEGTIAPGPATLARIGGPELRDVFVSDGEIVPAAEISDRCRTQVTLKLAAGLGDLLSRPLGNHHVLARGHHATELSEYHDVYVRRA